MIPDANYIETLIDNAATASQCDFDEVTREAIRLNVADKLIELSKGEYERGRRAVLDAITYTDSKGGIYNSYIETADLRGYL